MFALMTSVKGFLTPCGDKNRLEKESVVQSRVWVQVR